MATQTQTVLSFWFEDHGPADWFKKDADFDLVITARFKDFYQKVRNKTTAQIFYEADKLNKNNRRAQAEYMLAHIILYDQFTRNMYRDTSGAFASDALALDIAHQMIQSQHDLELTIQQRVFAYMPYMHSENLQDQKTAVSLYAGLEGMEENARYAQAHLDVIAEFGRFPHRNKILGRVSTPLEEEYLKRPDAGF